MLYHYIDRTSSNAYLLVEQMSLGVIQNMCTMHYIPYGAATRVAGHA